MGLLRKRPRMKVLFVSSEAGPFMKVGGLGEVMHALPKELRALGWDARVMVPKYASMDTARFPFVLEARGIMPMPTETDPYGLFISNVLRNENEKGEVVAYFLENMEYYEKRANVYGYADDAVRWALLSKGTLEFLRQSPWRPDVIVACDWQAGLIPNLIATEYKNDSVFESVATVFSIHNLAYQGMFDHHFISEMEYDSGESPVPSLTDPRLQKLNFMRRGIRYADVVNTVSPTYAQEITTADYGELLDDLLRERRSRLFGILNGIDYGSYNPETDSFLEFRYSFKTAGERIKNKAALQRKFNLPERPDTLLLGIVSRLNEQKGFHLLMDTAQALFTNLDVQLIVVGAGESEFMTFFQGLPELYPGKVAVHLTYDEALPRMIYGGADVVLIPSRYEPSGLTQMEVMRYGGVPLVRKTGGLADSVENYNPRAQTGTGFVFEPFDHYAFFGAIARAFETYQYPKYWAGIQKRAMQADFSWTKSAREYIALFKKAIELKRSSAAL
ncbi:MAG: glycogen synthase [Candidatus Sungbacteria bacterium]|uniref:Glycogen synthase n=1 Tax=Candidatus Sungiibacteriota bacterium TaxID=2750080 RepID=A0A931SCA6_9BACT|nr:glycogen synthase [Candidatus Sungbacteria bacterium]